MDTIMDFLNNLDKYLDVFLSSIGIWGPILSCLLIVVESILPALPLCVFITLLFIYFGSVIGFLISWICTCIGCSLSFFLCRKLFRNYVEKKLKGTDDGKVISKLKRKIDNMKVSSLAALVSIPFTPAFAVNIAAGISKMKYKKFISALLIGKLFMVYFWGYMGTTLIECITHPEYLIKVVVMVSVSFIASKLANKFLKLD